MQANIHPAYETVQVTCSCGNKFKTGSAACKDIHVEVCSKCHPFYTGNQKIVDSEGRVEGFRKKFARFGAQIKTKN